MLGYGTDVVCTAVLCGTQYLMKKGAVGGKKNPEPDQETLCRDGYAVNRQRILTIAAT